MGYSTNETFSGLVEQYERLVYTVCFQLVRDAAAAEASLDSYAAAIDALYGALAEKIAERGQTDLL